MSNAAQLDSQLPVFNPMLLTGRRYLVTGASSGIGQATSVMLSRLGARLVCCGRNSQRLEETCGLLSGQGHSAETYDLMDLDGVSDWVKTIGERMGGLHGLVHAAGLQSPMPLYRIKRMQWEKMRSANLDSLIELVRGFQSSQAYAGEFGRIVLLSTVLASSGSPGRSAYAATKGAIEGLIPSLALELAPRKICVNAIAPAFVKTPMYEDMARFWNPDQLAEVERRHPLGFGEPDDVAGAIAFLLADTGRWITGTVLHVDGGYLAG